MSQQPRHSRSHAQSGACLHSRAPAASAHLRMACVARLIAAEQSLPANPDAAALLLDGALSQMLEAWAHSQRLQLSGGAALSALEERSPAIAWRLRLALQASGPEARLAHCWALLDLLTSPTPVHHRGGAATFRDKHRFSHHHDQRRKDSQSHVS